MGVLGTWPHGAAGQINVLSPLFRDLNGAAIWGSTGVATGSSSDRDQRPIWRGGFAAFYGPFGGGGDTTAIHAFTVSDSTDTVLARPDGSRTWRHLRSSTELRNESKRIGRGGKVTVAIGYQHSAYYRIRGTPLTSTVALGGPSLAVFLGPYDLPLRAHRLQWYAGVGGTILQWKNMAGRVDTFAVKLDTERTLAPEFYWMSTYRVGPNYRVLLAASYQHLRFGSLAYRPVEDGRLLPADVLARLPEDIQIESVHLMMGVSFAASSLFPAH